MLRIHTTLRGRSYKKWRGERGSLARARKEWHVRGFWGLLTFGCGDGLGNVEMDGDDWSGE